MINQFLQAAKNALGIHKKEATQPAKVAAYNFFKNYDLEKEIFQKGYAIVDFTTPEIIRQIKAVFETNHALPAQEGATFFTVFSKNTEYRKKVHQQMGEILQLEFEKWFRNYKSIANAFVIKTPGSKGRIPIHQDLAAIDEEKFSSINVWLPLQSITSQNGPLYVIPGSHHFFYPYRCATTPPIQTNFEEKLYPYFIPLYLIEGQALFFDSRLFHFSEPNLSSETRVVAVSRVCPANADIVTYLYNPLVNSAQVEMWKCPSDYLLTSDVYTGNTPPPEGILLGYKPYQPPPSSEDFDRLSQKLALTTKSNTASYDCREPNFIHEPVQLQK